MKTETLIAGVILIIMCLSLYIYAQNYVTAIQNSTNITSADKQMISFIPTLLIVFILVLAGMLIWKASRGR
jgi:hypothetical protein